MYLFLFLALPIFYIIFVQINEDKKSISQGFMIFFGIFVAALFYLIDFFAYFVVCIFPYCDGISVKVNLRAQTQKRDFAFFGRCNHYFINDKNTLRCP